MKTKTRKRFEHIDEIPEFAELQKQLAELHAQRNRALETIATVGPTIQMSGHDAAALSEAARLLGDIDTEAATQLQRQEQHEAAQLTVDATTIAIGKLTAKHDDARHRASAAICEQRLAEHQELAGDIGHALKLLRDALRDERHFRDELERAGASFKAPLSPVAMPIENWFAQCDYNLDIALND